MIRHRFFVFALAIVVLSTDVAAVAQADVFDEWNVHAEQAIVITGAQNPAVASLSFAIFQGAVYDAVNAIDRRFTPFISQFNAPADASLDAAIAAAAHGVLLGLFPAQQADLETKYANSLAGIPNGSAKDAGIAVGQAAAAAMLAARANDGRFIDVPEYYIPLPPGPGVWVPVAGRGVFPWIGYVTPFSLESPDQFAPKDPSLSRRRWVRDYNEVKDYGGSISLLRNSGPREHRSLLGRAHGADLESRATRDCHFSCAGPGCEGPALCKVPRREC
jgi:hypothetical protein